MASMTDFLENEIRGHLLLGDAYSAPGTVYLALFTSATTDLGGGTEVTAGANTYARAAVAFTAGATGVATSSADEVFVDMPGVTVTHAALMDAATAGNMLLHGPLSAAKTVTAGATLTFPAGDITATFA